MFAQHDHGKPASDPGVGPRLSAEDRLAAMLDLWPERKSNAARIESFLGALVRICRQQQTLPPADRLREIAGDIVGDEDQHPLAQYSLDRAAKVAYSLSELGCREAFCYQRFGDRVCEILTQTPKAAGNHRALSKMAAALAQARHYHGPFFEAVDAGAAAGGWPAREAVRLLWSHAALARPNEQLFKTVDRELMPRLSELPFAALADLISSHAVLQVSGDEALTLVAAVSGELSARLAAGAGADGALGEDLRKVVQNLTKRGTVAAELALKCSAARERAAAASETQILGLLSAVGDYGVQHFDTIAEQDLIGFAGAFSSVRYRHDPLLQAIVERMGPRLRLCSPSGLSTLAHTFSIFDDHKHETFVRMLLQESIGRLQEFTEPVALKGLKHSIIGHIHMLDLAQLTAIVERYADLHLLDVELANHVCWSLPMKMACTDPMNIPAYAVRICAAMTAAGFDLLKAPSGLRW